ncbi:hypothetical protein [Hymenobacter sp. BT491]|uniref:hypothetical protein n=1 Tax=Hymenobacter sp. BT491 TaxID=2766779 RepID=UPI0016537513|nr:hypothetical protein [Hymenobacter sp. BT491]MBC6989788.1 hypothetical protein [Hymenobacter sp. BT491]
MTRASLLHILDHVSEISEAEIRELEQLAAAFPYCQTAHVLLAKAAHDRGSMLASQRLRRAATYAADRQLLRQLIERPAPVLEAASSTEHSLTEPYGYQAVEQQVAFQDALVSSETSLPEELVVSEEYPEAIVQEESTESRQEEYADSVTEALESEASTVVDQPEADTFSAEIPALDLGTENADQEAVIAEESAAPSEYTSPEESHEQAREETLASSQDPIAFLEEAATQGALPNTDTAEPAVATAIEPVTSESSASDGIFPAEEVSAPLLESNKGKETDEEEITSTITPSLPDTYNITKSKTDDVLLPVAPPIRPPVEVGTSRFEFGLGGVTRSSEPAYELPALEETVETTPKTDYDFRSDLDLGYALGLGSRMGSCLQLRDELTQDLPTEDFFPPDAVLAAHGQAHRPIALPPPSTLELINQFLRNKPRLKSAAKLPAPTDEQADLSVRSTASIPEIASESLAKIMVKQGKIAKAIEIYERLMVRQPEKKAYFADQIQQLKPSE